MDEGLLTQAIANLDKVIKKIEEIQEMCKVEKKEPRKLWEIIDGNFFHPQGYPESYKQAAKVAIDSVIECYEEFDNRDCYDRRTFPEYLKEKML